MLPDLAPSLMVGAGRSVAILAVAALAGCDPDSTHLCGNGVHELGHEACDDGNLVSNDGCSAQCALEEGWFCDDELEVQGRTVCHQCGDGVLQASEECDLGEATCATIEGDCPCVRCEIQEGFRCEGEPSVCHETYCGDGLVRAPETCDLGKGDDPSRECEDYDEGSCPCQFCEIQRGYVCEGEPSVCHAGSVCGDGFVIDPETCDLGEDLDEAACEARFGGPCPCLACDVQQGFVCTDEPSVCVQESACDVCGDFLAAVTGDAEDLCCGSRPLLAPLRACACQGDPPPCADECGQSTLCGGIEDVGQACLECIVGAASCAGPRADCEADDSDDPAPCPAPECDPEMDDDEDSDYDDLAAAEAGVANLIQNTRPPVDRAICEAGDEDFFRTDAMVGDPLFVATFELTGLPRNNGDPAGDLDLTIYSGEGEQVAEAVSVETSETLVLPSPPLPNAWYYVRVFGKLGQQVGRYQLTVSFGPDLGQ